MMKLRRLHRVSFADLIRTFSLPSGRLSKGQQTLTFFFIFFFYFNSVVVFLFCTATIVYSCNVVCETMMNVRSIFTDDDFRLFCFSYPRALFEGLEVLLSKMNAFFLSYSRDCQERFKRAVFWYLFLFFYS